MHIFVIIIHFHPCFAKILLTLRFKIFYLYGFIEEFNDNIMQKIVFDLTTYHLKSKKKKLWIMIFEKKISVHSPDTGFPSGP